MAPPQTWGVTIISIPQDIMALTLKKSICAIFLSRDSLSIQNIRGQGYDGASNMHGEWNGLQALFLKDCSFAYYIHCFAHRLKLALVAASKEVKNVYHFFTKLTTVVNIVGVSYKRYDELQVIQAEKIAHLLAIDEIESSRELNQIGTLQRAGDTRWSSHFNSVCSLIKMFDATCSILQNIITDDSTYSQRGDADVAYDAITSFEFIFILHLMQEIMEITDNLCQALQSQSQDILNALELVSTTKVLIQKIEKRWLGSIAREGLVKTGKSVIYPLVDRLICLVLTLPVSTTTIERAFSAMKIVKTRLRNKMEDEFLANTLVVNIEKEIAEKFTIESII
ncbi:hypothetical protein HHK36_008976 [Tetracentron sinense]|uniref:Zinc finger MYM-type protein 1-like n=1 Tax=Tetracentron sinense TaxID=13715 RepID=A0A834ZCT6_TETSI|nr:hypothetical protein HHK36_008976 [Tetracentron sinense]